MKPDGRGRCRGLFLPEEFIMTNVKAADTTLFHKLSILIAGILWGCMGLFVRPHDALGLSSWDIVFLRACLTTLFMLLLIL